MLEKAHFLLFTGERGWLGEWNPKQLQGAHLSQGSFKYDKILVTTTLNNYYTIFSRIFSPLWFSSTSLIRDCSLQKNTCLVLGDIKSRVLTQLLKFDPIFASLFYSTSCVNLPLYKQVLYALTSLCKFSIMLSITSYGT